MSDATTELDLQLAVDDDDTADYLTIGLRQSLQSVDGLFNQAAGHTHSGPHQGGLIAAAAFGGPMDLPDWFRSTGQRSGFATSGQGLEMYWSGAAGVLQSYDRGANAYRDLILEGATIHLARSGTDALVIDGSSNVNIANSLTVTGTLNATGQTTLNATQVNGTLTSSGLQVNGNGTVTGTFTVGGSTSLQTTTVNGTLTSGGLQINGNGTVTGILTANSNLVSTAGVIQSGAAIGGMSAGDISANRGSSQGRIYLGTSTQWIGWTGGRYEFNNGAGGGQVTIWDCLGVGTTQLNTGGSAYRLTLPNNSDHTGKGIAFGWDSYSAAAGKDEITPLAEPLAIVTHPNVHGVTYKVKDGGPDQVGFVADQWMAVFPSLVSVDEQGQAIGMDYGRVGAVTFAALKQLAEMVQVLTDRVAALESSHA